MSRRAAGNPVGTPLPICPDTGRGETGTNTLPRTGDQAATGVVLALVALLLGTAMAFAVRRPSQL